MCKAALTRSAGGGLASFSHAQFAGANGGMAMGAEDPEERTEAPPAKAQAAGTVFWLLPLAVQLPTAATPWLAAGLPKLPDPFRGYALAPVRGCRPS